MSPAAVEHLLDHQRTAGLLLHQATANESVPHCLDGTPTMLGELASERLVAHRCAEPRTTRYAEQSAQEGRGATLQHVDVPCRASTSPLFGLPLQDAAKAVLRHVLR